MTENRDSDVDHSNVDHSNVMIDLDDLISRTDRSVERQRQTFDEILQRCHEKIKKYNRESKQHQCFYEPPHFLIGKPLYEYDQLVRYLIRSLQHNGLYAEWIPNHKSIYISWDRSNIDPHRFTQTLDETQQQISPFKEVVVLPQQKPPRKSKRKTPVPVIQHVALVNYGRGINDLIPVNSIDDQTSRTKHRIR